MSKNELVSMYYKIDKNKYKLMEKGIAFQFTINDGTGFLNTGIGTGIQMSTINLFTLLSLFQISAKEGTTIEDFAESVKQGLIEAWENNAFDIKKSGGKK